ncbi:low molecular weight protein-tyrosine-phosphatase, partial [Nonlabens dokdonensis]|uniref:low molecular weight protein-tyrosine-phosphatase n=1 Tax=Nonlabens dokdonensis TaxID=328515 RepID=UPI0026EE9EFC
MKTNILMICLGNICRSPLAEGLMRSKLNFTKFTVDSAGTSGGHKGEAPDKRSIAVAKKYGLDISNQKSRKLIKEDFQKFDYLYVMDESNYRDVVALAANEDEKKKVIKILDEVFPSENLDVPDPYYGGNQG